MSSGRFACGRVLQLGGEAIPSQFRTFFGGLHNWLGVEAPTSEAIAGAPFVGFGVMHIRAITKTGGEILGIRPLERDGIELPVFISGLGGVGVQVLSGASHVREARRDEWGTMPVLSVWGYNHIRQLAEAKLEQDA